MSLTGQVVGRDETADNELRLLVARVWGDALGLDVDDTTDFFASGGHSLLATQVVTLLGEELGCDIDVALLFEQPAFASFVASLHEFRPANPVRELTPVDRSGRLPLSFSQHWLWNSQREAGPTPFYNVPCSFRLRGDLDRDALQRALDEIVVRQESLRTTFPGIDGEPHQVVSPPEPVALRVVDLQAEPDPAATAASWVRGESREPFDVETGPILRVSLLVLAPDDHVVMLCLHHIASDGSSMRVLGAELSALYGAYSEGRPSPLAPLPVQFVDFASWQAATLDDAALEPHVAYWREQLADAETLWLPTDAPRVLLRSWAAGQLRFRIPDDTERALRALAREHNATLFMVLLAAFQGLLSRATGQTDISVGTPVANRKSSAVEGLVGFFANTLVMRADTTGNPTFSQLVGQARRNAIDAYSHQDAPFERLVDELEHRTPKGCSPFFQVHFQLLQMPLHHIPMGALDAEFFESSSGASPIDLFIHCFESADGIEGWVEYAAGLFEHETIERLLDHFLKLLATWAPNPDLRLWDVPLGPKPPTRPDADADDDATPLDVAITSRADAAPEALTVVDGARHLTGAELGAQVEKLARVLASGPDRARAVGVCAPPSLERVVGVLAAMRSGASVVLLDPEDPPARRSDVATRVGVDIFLATADIAVAPTGVSRVVDLSRVPDAASVEQDAGGAIARGSLTTATLDADGEVALVTVDHGAVAAKVRAMQAEFALEPRDRVLHQWSPNSYWFVSEVLWPLAAGAQVVVAPPQVSERALADLLVAEGISVLHTTPDQLALLLRSGTLRRTSRLRLVFCSSEGATPEFVDAFSAQSGASLFLVHAYAETAGAAMVREAHGVGEAHGVVAPRTLAGTHAAVLDPEGAPCAVGDAGTLEVGLGAVFATTGERARVLESGPQPFRSAPGVVDARGRRMSLSGISAVLRRHPDLVDACVLLREDAPGDRRLVAYVEPAAPRVRTDDFGLAVERVAEWQAHFDALDAADAAASSDRAEVVAAMVRDASPERIYEVGCGAGGIMARLAPATHEYVASDCSQTMLDAARALVPDGAPVQFHHYEADDFLAIASEHFDVVLAEAVASFFPDQGYLERVVHGAIDATRPGGRVIFGAVRSLTEMDAFHVAQLSERGMPASSIDEDPSSIEESARRRARRRERELFVAPEFFAELAELHPRVERVEIEPCLHGPDAFRFDAVIHVGTASVADATTEVSDRAPVRADRVFTNDALANAALAARHGEVIEDVAAFARSQLSADLRPGLTVIVDRIPRLPDGLPDAESLPAPDGARPAILTVFRAPSTPTEALLVPIMADALGLDGVGVDDDFFALGGFSMLAVQVAAQAEELCGVEVDPALLFESPTVARLASAIDELVCSEATAGD